MPLESKQRRYLKGLAHSLEPTVRVGRQAMTPELVAETDRTLEAHELIKVRIDLETGAAAREELATRLATECRAELVATLGKIGILFRNRETNPKIVLPAVKAGA